MLPELPDNASENVAEGYERIQATYDQVCRLLDLEECDPHRLSTAAHDLLSHRGLLTALAGEVEDGEWIIEMADELVSAYSRIDQAAEQCLRS